MPNKRPGTRTHTTTPMADALIRLLGGGLSYEGFAITSDQLKHLRALYEMTIEPENKRPDPPQAPPTTATWKEKEAYQNALEQWKRWQDPRPMMQAGADRNMLRIAQLDGLRMVTWIAKYLEKGQDPLKLLIQMAANIGYDVDPEELAWADEEEG